MRAPAYGLPVKGVTTHGAFARQDWFGYQNHTTHGIAPSLPS